MEMQSHLQLHFPHLTSCDPVILKWQQQLPHLPFHFHSVAYGACQNLNGIVIHFAFPMPCTETCQSVLGQYTVGRLYLEVTSVTVDHILECLEVND